MTTLKDIAAHLELSTATVSRALNGFPEVGAETRAKVRAAADQLGYHPNRAARGLVTGRSGLVGMILSIRPDMTADQSFFEILTGLTAALAARDVDLVLTVDQFDDQVVPYRRMIERSMVDGFILNAPQGEDPRLAFLRARGIPFVVHGRAGPQADYPFYDIDNHAVAAGSIGLLADLGHRRIALLNGDARLAYSGQRLSGYLSAMKDAEAQVPEGYVVNCPPTQTAGYTDALALLSGRHGARPTALICASIEIAIGALRAAADLSLHVPQDLSVIAHDDGRSPAQNAEARAALTVTQAPLSAACAPLANHLLDRIAGAALAQVQTLVQPDLIVRNSTGPAPRP